VNNKGVESSPMQFVPKATDFELPIKVPKVKMPKVPTITLPEIPCLPEQQRQELEDIQRR
jgi:hypothetical protein